MPSGKPFPLTSLGNRSMKLENKILRKTATEPSSAGLKMVTWAPMACQGSLSPQGCLTWHLSQLHGLVSSLPTSPPITAPFPAKEALGTRVGSKQAALLPLGPVDGSGLYIRRLLNLPASSEYRSSWGLNGLLLRLSAEVPPASIVLGRLPSTVPLNSEQAKSHHFPLREREQGNKTTALLCVWGGMTQGEQLLRNDLYR